MKPLILLTLLALAVPAHAGYFYVTAGSDGDSDHDAALNVSEYSTLATCEAKAATAAALVQGCVPDCNAVHSTTAYFVEQFTDGDNDGGFQGLYRGRGPYGLLTDCEAGITDAINFGITDVLSACTAVTRHSCK